MKNIGFFYKKEKNSFNELKNRLLYVLWALIIFRIGSFIPIPGINISIFTKILDQQQGTIIEIFNMFSGGALSHASIFALGIMPYISSSIIIQLISVISPTLSEIKKDGESGKRKINQYIRYTTLLLSIIQSFGIATSISKMPNLVINNGLIFYFTAITSLVCGTMFLMWLGEQISDKGIGNGISIIIFAGIVANLPNAIANTIEQTRSGNLPFMTLILILLLIFLVTFFVVFIERGQRRIVVNYAKRQKGRSIYITQNTHLPLKINVSGVIPAIFASSIILFPATISSWFGSNIGWYWFNKISFYLQPGKLCYMMIYAMAIVFFCFFYTALIFNPRETADNLKKSGAFIPGIRPGEQTAKYINKVVSRLTLFGAIYITFICLIPEFMRNAMHVPFYFGGTSLLIVVVVIMNFMIQIQTLIMSNQYESILKKINFKKN